MYSEEVEHFLKAVKLGGDSESSSSRQQPLLSPSTAAAAAAAATKFLPSPALPVLLSIWLSPAKFGQALRTSVLGISLLPRLAYFSPEILLQHLLPWHCEFVEPASE